MPGELLILTGPPGSGKTTIARLLAARPGIAKVHLHADDFWMAIGHGAIAPHLPAAHDQNEMVIAAIAAAAAAYVAGGYCVILDGIIGPWFLPPFAALGVPISYVVLRPALDQAIARCAARSDQPVPREAVEAMHAQLVDLGKYERHALPVDDKTPAHLADAIDAAVAEGRFRLA